MKPLKRDDWMTIGLILMVGGTGLVAAQETATEQMPLPESAIEQPLTEAEPPAAAPVLPPVPPAAPVPAPARPAPAAKGTATVDTIDFNNAPVPAVLEYYSRLTGRSIIAAPNLPGVITFRSQSRLTLDEALQALDSVLAINNIGVIPMGEKFLKVVPIQSAKQEGLPFGHGSDRELPPGDTVITHVVMLKYADAAEVVAALQPYIHPYGQLLPLAKSNSILITDTGANISQITEIVKFIDQPSALRMETKVYELKHAKAAEVVQRLQSIVQETQQLGARATAPTSVPAPQPTPAVPTPAVRPVPGRTATVGTVGEESVVEGKVIITPDERTNKIFLLSRTSNFAFFDRLIAELDAKVEPDVVMKVIELKYANAEDASSLLNALITGSGLVTTRRSGTTGTGTTGTRSTTPTLSTTPATGGTGAAGQAGGFLQYAEGVRVLPDSRTNSLLIMATKEDMERIEGLVRDIDTAVAQVLVEVVIGEVKLDGRLEFGVNLLQRLFQGGELKSIVGTAVSTDSSGNPAPGVQNLAALAAGSGLPSGAAISSALTYFGTFTKLNLDVAVKALASTSKFKVLSTPIIQTLHNQEGSIVVGESRPVVTSTISSITGTSTSTNTSSGSLQASVDYKDIAIELKVTPRINPDGYVTMDIDQKINDVAGNVIAGGSEVPIITKREAKSSVTVKNQSTIVLGGLIRENNTVTESKVPFLGDIPFLGHVFKNKSTEKAQTELIVFIRPTVLRSATEAVSEARRRSELMKGGEELGLEKHFSSADDAADVEPSTE